MDLNEIIRSEVRRLVREGEIFRKGTITAVDDPGDGSPIVYTVNDGATNRDMTATQAGLAVGDIGPYVDQSDPFYLGKFHRG